MYVCLYMYMHVCTGILRFNFLLPMLCLNENWYLFKLLLSFSFPLAPTLFFSLGCSFSHFTLTDAKFQRIYLFYIIVLFNFLISCLTAQSTSVLDYPKTLHPRSQSFECLWWNWTFPPHTFPMSSTQLFIKALLFHISDWPWIYSWKDFQKWYCLKP